MEYNRSLLRLRLTLLLLSFFIHFTRSGSSQLISDDRGTCLVNVWNTKIFVFAADTRTVHYHELTLPGPDYLKPLQISGQQSSAVKCKVNFSENGVLVSATGTTFTPTDNPIWDAKQSAVQIINRQQGAITDEYLMGIAEEWQSETEVIWRKLDLMHHTHFLADHQVTVSLILAAKTADGQFTTVYAPFETLQRALHRIAPTIDHPPQDGHTGIVPYGICSNYASGDFTLTSEEIAEKNLIVRLKNTSQDVIQQSNLAIRFEDWSSKVSSRFASGESSDTVAIVAPPFDLAYETPDEQWKLRPSTSGCTVKNLFMKK